MFRLLVIFAFAYAAAARLAEHEWLMALALAGTPVAMLFSEPLRLFGTTPPKGGTPNERRRP